MHLFSWIGLRHDLLLLVLLVHNVHLRRRGIIKKQIEKTGTHRITIPEWISILQLNSTCVMCRVCIYHFFHSESNIPYYPSSCNLMFLYIVSLQYSTLFNSTCVLCTSSKNWNANILQSKSESIMASWAITLTDLGLTSSANHRPSSTTAFACIDR